MTVLSAKRLNKRYGDMLVLDNVAFEVEQGEFVTLVGPSGCGKSTFLKLLLGIEPVSSGKLELNGKPLSDEPGPDRGVVFQRYSVFSHLTVLKNVMFHGDIQNGSVIGRSLGGKGRKIREEATRILTEVGLGNELQKYPHELSGGMQQRLAIAQALVAKPEILLLDEPFGALDPGIRKDMRDLLTRLWQETGVTIFMVTHDVKEAFDLGTRLWVFDKKRHDPQAPNAYGATITYDIRLNRPDELENRHAYEAITSSMKRGV